MHKSKGNAIWFEEAADRMGVDVMRWLFCRHSPVANLNFGWHSGDEIRRGFILTLWNTYSFFVTYANLDRFQPQSTVTEAPALAELDRWILSGLNQLVDDVTADLEEFDSMAATRRIEGFTEELSNWYVRRSRRRFWKSENDADKRAAYETLHNCLVTLSRILAPFLPFLAEEMYQNLVRSHDKAAPESVHLCDWPEPDLSRIDLQLDEETRLVMRVASLAHAARSRAGIKVRQPVGRLVVVGFSSNERRNLEAQSRTLLDELNIKELAFADDASPYIDAQVSLNKATLGPRYGPRLAELQELARRPEALEQLGSLFSPEDDEPVGVAGRVRAARGGRESGGPGPSRLQPCAGNKGCQCPRRRGHQGARSRC